MKISSPSAICASPDSARPASTATRETGRARRRCGRRPAERKGARRPERDPRPRRPRLRGAADHPVPSRRPTASPTALRAIAHRTREALVRHPWLIDTMGSRPLVTPNALRHIEQSVAVVIGLDVARETAVAMVMATDDYTIGHAFRRARLAAPGSPRPRTRRACATCSPRATTRCSPALRRGSSPDAGARYPRDRARVAVRGDAGGAGRPEGVGARGRPLLANRRSGK